jgi:hypothetical protein
MSYIFEIAPHILEELWAKIASGNASFSTERGDLYVHDQFYMGAIKLKVSADEYVKFLESTGQELPPAILIPQKDNGFDIYVNGVVTLENGRVLVNGQEVTIL